MIEIATPSNPVSLASMRIMGWALDVSVKGSVAHVAAGGAGLIAIDVSNPTFPVETSHYDTGGFALQVSSGYQIDYVADRGSGMKVIDLSDPASPVQLISYSPLGLVRWSAVQGDYAYLAASYEGLQVVDVSEPSHPRLVGSYVSGDDVNRVIVRGQYAYVARLIFGPGGNVPLVRILDISDPTEPVLIGKCYGDGAVWDMELVGNLLYLAEEWGLTIFDVSDPFNPRRVGVMRTVNDDPWLITGGIAVHNDIAYVQAENSIIIVVDVSDPERPVRLRDIGWRGFGDITIAKGLGFCPGWF